MYIVYATIALTESQLIGWVQIQLNTMVIIFNAKIIDNAGIFSARKDQLLNFEKCYYVIATNRDYQAYLYPTLTENMHLTAAPSLSL